MVACLHYILQMHKWYIPVSTVEKEQACHLMNEFKSMHFIEVMDVQFNKASAMGRLLKIFKVIFCIDRAITIWIRC